MYQIFYYIYSIVHLNKKIFSSNQDKWLGYKDFLDTRLYDTCKKLAKVSLENNSLPLLKQQYISEIKNIITAGASLQTIRQAVQPEIWDQNPELANLVIQKYLKDSIAKTFLAQELKEIQAESENVCFLLGLAKNKSKEVIIQDSVDLEIDDSAKQDDISLDDLKFFGGCVESMWLSMNDRISNSDPGNENIRELTINIIPKFIRCWSMIAVELLDMPLSIYGYRALHSVIRTPPFVGQQDIVKSLLDNGANPNIQDSDRKTPLQDAIVYEQADIVKILLSDVRTNVVSGLLFATSVQKADIVQILLEHKRIDINLEISGWRALKLAIYRENKEIVGMLLAKGAKIAPDFNYALEKGNVDIVTMLLTELRNREALNNEKISESVNLEQFLCKLIENSKLPVACKLNMLKAFAEHLHEKKEVIELKSAQIDFLLQQVQEDANEDQKQKLAFIFNTFVLEEQSSIPQDIKDLIQKESEQSKQGYAQFPGKLKSARATGEKQEPVEFVIKDKQQNKEFDPHKKNIYSDRNFDSRKIVPTHSMNWSIDLQTDNKVLQIEGQDLAGQVDENIQKF